MIQRLAIGVVCLGVVFTIVGCDSTPPVTNGGGNRLPDSVVKEVEQKNKESADLTPEQKMEQMRESSGGAKK